MTSACSSEAGERYNKKLPYPHSEVGDIQVYEKD
jgi:hypothetical protein